MKDRQERMKGSIAWMAANPVSANLLMAAIVIGGFAMAFFQMRQEVIPQMDLDMVQITVPYPGASPEEVERGILLVVEESVRAIDGVKQVMSSAGEGYGSVTVELETGTERNKALSDIKNAVDRITTFPRDAERPVVMVPQVRVEAISIVIYGDQTERVLREIAEQTRDKLLDLEEITYVELSGVRSPEIGIEVPAEQLRAYGTTLPQIADKIRRTALELPAGGVKTRGGEILLRTSERRELGTEFENIPIITGQDGVPVYLSDIAKIKDGFGEDDFFALYDGKPAVTLNVFAVGDESPTKVAAAAKAFALRLEKDLPPGVSVSKWRDLADLYGQRLDLLLRNAQIGLVLVLIVLGLFLEPRLAFWVTIGIPISFMGAFLLLPVLGISLNMISLFAFIVTLGMVVDDAIVVGENVFRLKREGLGPLDAAISGAQGVSMPVFFSIITTIAAFSPFLFIPGTSGKFFLAIPVVVILVLAVSLIESFWILPAHLSHQGKTRRLSFWVVISVIFGFLGAFLILPALGMTVDIFALVALVIICGIALENMMMIGSHVARLQNNVVEDAGSRGVHETIVPAVFSTLTTAALFLPILGMSAVGLSLGVKFAAISVILILIYAMESVVVSKLFKLPDHIDFEEPRILQSIEHQQIKISRGMERFIEKVYAPVLRLALRERWITLALAIATFIATIGLITGGIVKFTPQPKEESDWIVVEAKLPFGSAVTDTKIVMERIVKAAHETIGENGGDSISKGIFSMLGREGSHTIRVIANLVPTVDRPLSSSEFAAKWRQKVGDIPNVESLSFDSSTGRASSPIDIELSHRSVKILESAAKDLALELATFEGVKDINDGVAAGKSQMDFTMSEAGIAVGLTSADLASQVRSAFYGIEALRQQRGRDEIRVMVRLPKSERENLTNIEDLMIRTPSGGEIPLRMAANVKHGRAYTEIKRTDGRRTKRVKADVEEGKANSTEVLESVFEKVQPQLKERYPGLSFGSAGRQKSNDEFMEFLNFAYMLALVGIFILIAIPLRSYLQPLFVVMMAIPFGVVGAILGHLIMGFDLSFVSLMGIVALTGVVVNDSLVLVDAANNFKTSGLSRFEAAEAAGKRRFRAVVLTSLTTFGGLSPMILETSVQARVLIPMAISLGFGVLFSTMITLVLVPSLFVMIEGPRDWFKTRQEAE